MSAHKPCLTYVHHKEKGMLPVYYKSTHLQKKVKGIET